MEILRKSEKKALRVCLGMKIKIESKLRLTRKKLID